RPDAPVLADRPGEREERQAGRGVRDHRPELVGPRRLRRVRELVLEAGAERGRQQPEELAEILRLPLLLAVAHHRVDTLRQAIADRVELLASEGEVRRRGTVERVAGIAVHAGLACEARHRERVFRNGESENEHRRRRYRAGAAAEFREEIALHYCAPPLCSSPFRYATRASASPPRM